MPADSKPKRIKPIAVEVMDKRTCVRFNGETIADSLSALVMLEPGHGPVYYLPRDDVRMDLFERTNHRSHCPHKGDASYWTISVGDRRAENAAWSYENPIPNVAAAKGYIAFYLDRIDSLSIDGKQIS